jgi:NTP pyrophosphatase (non-canonical NTP hydrolase)
MSTETAGKDLAAMTAEVQEHGRADGWYDSPVSFGEAMAYLHSEVSEAFEAWRIWGLSDGTAGSAISPGGDPGAKPEGIGSEFADVLIRLLDCCVRFGVDLEAEREEFAGAYGFRDSFPENMNTLHVLIARASEVHALGEGPGEQFAGILSFLGACCVSYGIDLLAEYDRKMTWNRTNPHRHEKRQ